MPEDRLIVMSGSRKSTEHAKGLMPAQVAFSKTYFIVVTNRFIVKSMKSKTTLLQRGFHRTCVVMDISRR
ncbi:hypothetical protein [Paenibacillus odorifer]|uniref:hypothetical protein n=1 Tax=Paenibacillus sp. FSL H3-0329 TaxID=2954734 RepID=UPI001482C10D